MRFSTVTVSAAAVFATVAFALPQVVVTETEVVTITSCAPEKPDCPYATSSVAVPEHTPEPEVTSVEPEPTPEPTPEPEPETTPCTTSSVEVVEPEPTPEPEPETTPCTTSSVIEVPHYPNTTVSVPPVVSPVPTGTGTHLPPADNTTAPVVPTPVAPPASEGAAGKLGVSVAAVFGAAVLALVF